MKKFGAWLQVIVCSFFLLIFALSIIFLIPVLSKDTGNEMSSSDMATYFIGLLIPIVLCVFGLRNGIKKIRKNKLTHTVPFLDTLDLQVNGQITYKDYRNLIFGLTFKKPVYLIFMSILILFLVSFLINGNTSTQNETNYLPFVFLIIFILSPVMTLIQIKKLFQTNKLFQQPLTYHLTNEALHIKGNTVDSTLSWSNFYKVKETKTFFMLYTANTIATLLDKKMLRPQEIDTLRNFLKSLPVEKE